MKREEWEVKGEERTSLRGHDGAIHGIYTKLEGPTETRAQ